MEKKQDYVSVCGGIRMENNDTELVFIIDRSGSMAGFESDTVGGFNSMLKKQKDEGEGLVYVTTVLFSTECEMVHDRLPIAEVEPMTQRDYIPSGCTALLDALGETILHIEKIHRYAHPDHKPKNTVFVIITDGLENASTIYNKDKIKKTVERKTEKYGWEFIFLGANMDAIAEARDIGIRRERAANYAQTEHGFAGCYEAMSEFVTAMRCCASESRLDSWKRGLENEEDDS